VENHGTAPGQGANIPPCDREARIQETMGMVRRTMRNREIRLVEVLPTVTPHEVIMEWAAELTGKPAPTDLSNLADRLRDALVVEEDGALAGGRLVEAIDSQADRACDWTFKNKLRFLARTVETTLCELGML
jgi:hypothetical protein